MIQSDVFGSTLDYFLSPIRELLEDSAISEIMINGPWEIYVERRGEVHRTDAVFTDADQLRAAVNNIAQFVGRHLRPDEARFDARLPGGHRVHVVLPPVCRNGISVTIRKHSKHKLSFEDLIGYRSLTREAADFLAACVGDHRNIIVSGGTGTGKTTLLNVLSGLIPSGARIVVIEDSAELQIQQEHVVSLETRGPDRKGRGAVTIRDLLHSSLRMRPDRIIIGECRGGEALDLLQALNTGHSGSMSTVHADSPSEALKRLETLALFGGVEIPIRFLRAQVAAAIHVVVQLQRLGGRRLVQSIIAVDGLDEAENYDWRELYRFDASTDELVATAEAAGYLDG